MSSKQLHSILNKVPAATADGEKMHVRQIENMEKLYTLPPKSLEETDRIVAVIPKVLKEEIKIYLKNHKGDTEKIIILKALKLMGFNVPNEWLVDKRSTR
jgi:hypothetical protein